MSDPDDVPKSLSYRSVAGLFLSSGLAVVGLFALPVLQSFGLTFRPAFWLVLTIEAVALAGVIVSVLTLHRDRTLD